MYPELPPESVADPAAQHVFTSVHAMEYMLSGCAGPVVVIACCVQVLPPSDENEIAPDAPTAQHALAVTHTVPYVALAGGALATVQVGPEAL